MPVLNHVHQYIYRNLGTRAKPRKVYACNLPDCSHFMPDKKMVLHKKSICFECQNEFTITQDILTRSIVKPRCPKCRAGIKKVDAKADRAIELLMALKG